MLAFCGSLALAYTPLTFKAFFRKGLADMPVPFLQGFCLEYVEKKCRQVRSPCMWSQGSTWRNSMLQVQGMYTDASIKKGLSHLLMTRCNKSFIGGYSFTKLQRPSKSVFVQGSGPRLLTMWDLKAVRVSKKPITDR